MRETPSACSGLIGSRASGVQYLRAAFRVGSKDIDMRTC